MGVLIVPSVERLWSESRGVLNWLVVLSRDFAISFEEFSHSSLRVAPRATLIGVGIVYAIVAVVWKL